MTLLLSRLVGFISKDPKTGETVIKSGYMERNAKLKKGCKKRHPGGTHDSPHLKYSVQAHRTCQLRDFLLFRMTLCLSLK